LSCTIVRIISTRAARRRTGETETETSAASSETAQPPHHRGLRSGVRPSSSSSSRAGVRKRVIIPVGGQGLRPPRAFYLAPVAECSGWRRSSGRLTGRTLERGCRRPRRVPCPRVEHVNGACPRARVRVCLRVLRQQRYGSGRLRRPRGTVYHRGNEKHKPGGGPPPSHGGGPPHCPSAGAETGSALRPAEYVSVVCRC